MSFGFVINIIVGLFIWMVLPGLIYSKRKYKKSTPQFFVHIACKIVGIAIVAFSVLGVLKSFLS
jgi:hypothetical protein